jgi:hypothetical protein
VLLDLCWISRSRLLPHLPLGYGPVTPSRRVAPPPCEPSVAGPARSRALTGVQRSPKRRRSSAVPSAHRRPAQPQASPVQRGPERSPASSAAPSVASPAQPQASPVQRGPERSPASSAAPSVASPARSRAPTGVQRSPKPRWSNAHQALPVRARRV